MQISLNHMLRAFICIFFFFQAEDGIRDLTVTGVQTCALPISLHAPAVLFLDEPTSGVDPLMRREFWHHINALTTRGVAVVVTTHLDRKSTRLNSSHSQISYAVFCLKKKKNVASKAPSCTCSA